MALPSLELDLGCPYRYLELDLAHMHLCHHSRKARVPKSLVLVLQLLELAHPLVRALVLLLVTDRTPRRHFHRLCPRFLQMESTSLEQE